jgi:TRAP-type C4-dicarboxylate transport system substrate-binding protein
MPKDFVKTKLLVARQIAVFNGQVWNRLDVKAQTRLLTLAASIIATVERN